MHIMYIPRLLTVEVQMDPVTERAIKDFITKVVGYVASVIFSQMVYKAVLISAPTYAIFNIAHMRYSLFHASILEELLFRGCLSEIIKMEQKDRWKNGTEQEKTIQRIKITAIVFGAFHLLNPHSNLIMKISQFFVTTFAGFAWGYLGEKYKTLSVTIATHSLHNGLAYFFGLRERSDLALASTAALNVFWYVLGTDSLQMIVVKTQSVFNQARIAIKNSLVFDGARARIARVG